MKYVHGSVGAPGIAVGIIVQITEKQSAVTPPDLEPQEAQQRFAVAQAEVARYLQGLADELRAENKAAEAAIFDAQAMLARDPALTTEVERLLAQNHTALPDAVAQATASMAETLSALDDLYLRERAGDVRAVGQQIVAHLHGNPTEFQVRPGSIVIAPDLTPAQTANLRKSAVAGFATASGTTTGHVAILARALGIPAVVGLGDVVLDLPDGIPAILAADDGILIAEPTAEELAAYSTRQAEQQAAQQRRHGLVTLPAETTDAQQVLLWANIGHPSEAQAALDVGAQGIGLFRTEFLFLDRSAPPGEDEQFAAYAEVARLMAGRPVVIRTLDIGGDKPIPYLPQLHEMNPFLGWRGVRFAMRFRDLFQLQLRALLRAATTGDVRIMFPMIATPEDVAWAKAEIEAAASALAKEHVAYRADVPIGIMVETPAAALTLDLFAANIRFCSIGSNDLAQYTLAADRSEGQLGTRYRHNDPAVFRMIKLAATAARRLGLELGLCGELGGEPQAAVALVGLGIDKLSMNPSALLAVKEAIRAVSLTEAQQQARDMCGEPG